MGVVEGGGLRHVALPEPVFMPTSPLDPHSLYAGSNAN